jgi:hypothetical protein
VDVRGGELVIYVCTMSSWDVFVQLWCFRVH